jgi:hypothetical protein
MDEEQAVAVIVNGFVRDVLQALPMEFAMEAQSPGRDLAGRSSRRSGWPRSPR